MHWRANTPVISMMAAVSFWASFLAPPRAGADPRGEWYLRWIAPGADADVGQAAVYSLRLSTTPPGTDVSAWWSAAQPVPDPPLPQIAGSIETHLVENLVPGQRVYAAIRTSDAEGNWSEISPVVSWIPPGRPFIQSVSPVEVEPQGSLRFTITGLGLAGATDVRFYSSSGSYQATRVRMLASGELTARLTLSNLPQGPLDVEVVTPAGTDRLNDWILVRQPDAAAPEPPLDPLAAETEARLIVTREGAGWQVRIPRTSAIGEKAEGSEPDVAVYNVQGELIERLPVRSTSSGWETRWSARNSTGFRAGSGIFFMRAAAGDWVETRKLRVTR